MPTYEYECGGCGKHFEIFQSIKDAPVEICPGCGGKVKRLIAGGAGIIYKGGGFYNTDSAGRQTKEDPPKKDGKEGASKPKEDAANKASGPPCASCPKSETGACPAAS